MAIFRVATRLADSFYSVGPVLVLVLAGHQIFSWEATPWLVLALAAQLAVDGATGLVLTWFADAVAPRAQPQMLWLYVTDACLCDAYNAITTNHRPFLFGQLAALRRLLTPFGHRGRRR